MGECQTYITGYKISIYDQHTQFYTHCNLHQAALEPGNDISAETCDEMCSMSLHINEKICRSSCPIFLSYMEEYYQILIAIVVAQNIFLSCHKIGLKIVDGLQISSKTI